MNAPAQNNRAVEKSSPEAHVIAERGAHHRTWQRERFVTLPDGRTVNRPTGYTELATGLHYFENGAWRETREEIVITPSGAAAMQGPHRVQFTGNLNTHGAITLTAPDGKTLRSHVLGLAYTDTTTGESVFLGLIRDTEGVLHPPNEVVYPNAFSGVRADVRYIYTRQGFEQDVILRASLPTPESLGMKAETTLLEVWTEFVESPEPVIKLVPGPGSRTADQSLEFGTVRILRGHAFALDAPLNRMSAAPVVKQWVQAGTQRYLIESVRYSTILPELEKLPPHQAGLKLPAHEKNSRLALLQQIKPLETRPATPVRLALPNQPFQRHQGLVLDYVLYQGDRTNVTFQADTTYLLTDWFNVYGTATFEGGTVLKYNTTNNLILSVYDDVVCATEPYRPAIFTSRNDRTVGEDVYDGTPMQFHGAIAVATPGVEFKHLRISYAWRGLQTYGVKARHMQFGHCDTAFATFYTLFEEWGAAEFENVLIHDTRVAFGGAIYSNVVHHATVRACDLLTDDIYGYTSELYLTNSLLVNVTNWGVSDYFTNATVQTTDAAALQTVGAGAHCLATSSPYRNLGTTNLPATLAAELRRRTTYPPLVWSNVTLTTNLTLLPVAPRGGVVPDLGYHYAPLDYAPAPRGGEQRHAHARGRRGRGGLCHQFGL